uniref:protein acetyllysine N-acetyltransferase n=1 Tax=Megaselia scalaris TaxID=36166 RepID=T1GWS4_MEGSC
MILQNSRDIDASKKDVNKNYKNKQFFFQKFDDIETVEFKCKQLVDLIQSSNHTVIHTGAGISTQAGIPDFRGPKGVWTLEEKGESPKVDISFDDAIPTKTHMALKALIEHNKVQYIVSQNIDGLHLKSGVSRKYISELHGNMYVDECSKCKRQFVRKSATKTVGKKTSGEICRGSATLRPCRGGSLHDTILDWEHELPDKDLDLAITHSGVADLNIEQEFGGQLVICNLQPTKHDKKADLVISTYVDDILSKICKKLGIEIPEYDIKSDPTKNEEDADWNICPEKVKAMEKKYSNKLKDSKLNSLKRKKDYFKKENNKLKRET